MKKNTKRNRKSPLAKSKRNAKVASRQASRQVRGRNKSSQRMTDDQLAQTIDEHLARVSQDDSSFSIKDRIKQKGVRWSSVVMDPFAIADERVSGPQDYMATRGRTLLENIIAEDDQLYTEKWRQAPSIEAAILTRLVYDYELWIKSKPRPELLLDRPVDRSLKAYKNFILNLTEHLTGKRNDEMSAKEWRNAWKEFWSQADKE